MNMSTKTMLMVAMAVVVVLLTVFTGSSSAFFISNTRPINCVSATKPCRIQVQLKTLNGTQVETSGVQTCSCTGGHECSSDWDKPRHVINRKIVSTAYNITLQMMFCNEIEPARFCNRRDIALEVKGSLTLPQDVSSYNCRCRRRKPLLLQERGIGEDHMVFQKYVCANHKRTCASTDPCLEIGEVSTTYGCKCPVNHSCRAEPHFPTDPVTYGYCISNEPQPEPTEAGETIIEALDEAAL